jgi:regulator of sigma E protease
MELLAQIPIIGGTLAVVLPFLLVLSIIVFVHEFGHYIVGRWCGIRAEVFSIGFGKTLWSRVDRRGTKWQVATLPLGGFVKFAGDMDPASAGRADDADMTPEQRAAAFHNARLLPRVLTVSAGPVANFLLTIVIFTLMALSFGLPSEEPVIGTIGLEASENVGLEPGDRVLSIAGQEINSFETMLGILHKVDGHPQPAVVERNGSQLTGCRRSLGFAPERRRRGRGCCLGTSSCRWMASR